MSAESDEWGCRVRGRTSCPLPVDSGQHRATVPAVERLTKASSEEIANIVTLFLGLAIGSTMVGAEFLKPSTLAILILGIVAFALDASAGILFGKLMNLASGGRFNPLIGAAGISAFPMAPRVVHMAAQDDDHENFLLMHAMGTNAAGQVASVVAGGCSSR
jgi:oxaloacetate decarboxylase beta subunit